MDIRIDRHWSMEAPAEWEAALRAFSPIRTDVPWLALRWFPMKRQVKDGTWKDAGRWVLYECVHESLIDPTNEIVSLLSGPQPSRLRDPIAAKAKALYASDYQCAMYRTHRVWARNLWILQGSQGGHPIEYSMHEQKLLQAAGLPTDPPPLGGLPYAPFDQRVIAQLTKRNRLFKLGSIAALRRQGAADWQREFDEAEREFRKQHMAMLTEQMAASADFLDYYTTSSKTATECQNTIPQMSPEQQRRVAIAHEQYVDTGTLPT
jgi:hypothetical protein